MSGPAPAAYRYLGERAIEPARSIIIACPDCCVYWGGCAAESDCPECGKPANYFHDEELASE